VIHAFATALLIGKFWVGTLFLNAMWQEAAVLIDGVLLKQIWMPPEKD